MLFLPRYGLNVNDHKFCDEGKVILRGAINRSMSVFCGEREKHALLVKDKEDDSMRSIFFL